MAETALCKRDIEALLDLAVSDLSSAAQKVILAHGIHGDLDRDILAARERVMRVRRWFDEGLSESMLRYRNNGQGPQVMCGTSSQVRTVVGEGQAGQGNG